MLHQYEGSKKKKKVRKQRENIDNDNDVEVSKTEIEIDGSGKVSSGGKSGAHITMTTTRTSSASGRLERQHGSSHKSSGDIGAPVGETDHIQVTGHAVTGVGVCFSKCNVL